MWEDHIHICPFKCECWCSFALSHSLLITCFWVNSQVHPSTGLEMKIEVESPVPSRPPIKLIPHIFNAGPYLAKNIGQQQMLFSSLWSLT